MCVICVVVGVVGVGFVVVWLGVVEYDGVGIVFVYFVGCCVW